jgi:FkbM family methyltransferase
MIPGDEHYEIREKDIKGAVSKEWWWQAADQGAFAGPVTDWNLSHYTKYFKYCTERKSVLTAGANMGLYTRPYAHMFEKVYTFEPDLRNFVAMVRNSQYDNVFHFRAGLGAKSGFGTVKQGNATNAGMHKIEEAESGSLPIMTVDQLGIPALSLLQLDVEGYERFVIEGAEETIARCKPVIISESYHTSMNRIFEKNGYKRVDTSIADGIYVAG